MVYRRNWLNVTVKTPVSDPRCRAEFIRLSANEFAPTYWESERLRLNRVCWHLFFVLFLVVGGVQAENAPFSTWEGYEADKCASVWLIKRFIDPGAEIYFYPPGEILTEGIPFDTPEARFRRYHNRATYETLLEHYGLDDEKLLYIGRLIHDIEVNIWERKVFQESIQVKEDIRQKIEGLPFEVFLHECKVYFDKFYEELTL